MFSVLFEVQPKPDRWDAYLGYARMLRPQLERIDGFVDNVRYRSLTRPGWILSLSGWRDEKALVRWRVTASHHEVQAKGRSDVLRDYHLRVGQLTRDTRLPAGCALREQRLDETAAAKRRRSRCSTRRFRRRRSPRSRPRRAPIRSASTVRHPASSPGTCSMPCWSRATRSFSPRGARRARRRRSRTAPRCPRARACAASAWCVTTACSIDARHRSTTLMPGRASRAGETAHAR
jgi:heme-degrading monooxygenase HmoA